MALNAFLGSCGLGVGVEGATAAALAESLYQQGFKSPEDLGAIAPNGVACPAHRELGLRQVGPEGVSCWTKPSAAAGPWAERLATRPRPAPALLPLKPKVPGTLAPPRAPQTRPASQKQVTAAERRLATLALVRESLAPPQRLPIGSLRNQERAQMEAALARGMAFFQALGPRSPRYRVLYPNGHDRDPGPSQLAALGHPGGWQELFCTFAPPRGWGHPAT